MARHNSLQCTPDTNGYDFVVADGGMVIDDACQQNQAFLLIGNKGEFEDAGMGVGIQDMINDHEFDIWRRAIMEQLEADGQFVDYLNIDDAGRISLTAHYIN